MEKNINKRIDTYISEFKNEMWKKIASMGFSEKDKVNELLEFMYEYTKLSLTKDDFSKRKRVKNCIPELNRCNAMRANGEQCTRQRKDSCEYCGTHSKGSVVGASSTTKNEIQKKIEVFAQDINGIVYYIDNDDNVYKTEDILEEKTNPAIIAKCVKTESGYSIPEFGL
jgi:hypothetical protein